MADKNQKWDELDYSDENSEEYEDNQQYDEEEPSDSADNEEYEDDDSEEYEEDDEEYEDDEEETDGNKKSGGINKAVIAVILLLLLGGGGYFIAQSMSANKDSGVSSDIAMQTSQTTPDSQSASTDGSDFFENSNDGNQDLMNVTFDENGNTNVNNDQNNGEDVITVSDSQNNNNENDDLFINNSLEQQNQSNDSIMVSYNKAARLNPFKPPIIAGLIKQQTPYAVVDDTEFEIIEPPAASVPDENLTKLLQTQISGIMYDPTSPSAIINLNGTDYFVKIGDKVSGYLIKNITRDKVQVNYKNNTYVASVGQLFTKGTLEQQNVPDFEHKFAGRYKNSK